MVIEVIVTKLDAAFEQIEAKPESQESRRQRDTIAQWLDSALADGYRLGLVTKLPAPRLNAMFETQFGAQALDQFSVVVTGERQLGIDANRHPFDVALDALGVPRECAAAVASSESERGEAVRYGLSHCVRITDAVRPAALAS